MKSIDLTPGPNKEEKQRMKDEEEYAKYWDVEEDNLTFEEWLLVKPKHMR